VCQAGDLDGGQEKQTSKQLLDSVAGYGLFWSEN
jgi:hypothetical protein